MRREDIEQLTVADLRPYVSSVETRLFDSIVRRAATGIEAEAEAERQEDARR